MFWVATVTFIILLGTAVLDLRQLRRLIPAGLAGLVLMGTQVGVPESLTIVTLTDTGLVRDNISLTLLIQFIGGPVVGMWFAQGVGSSVWSAARRIGQFSLIALSFMWIAVEAGRARWRGPLPMLCFELLFYSLVWLVHAYCQGQFRRSPGGSYRA